MHEGGKFFHLAVLPRVLLDTEYLFFHTPKAQHGNARLGLVGQRVQGMQVVSGDARFHLGNVFGHLLQKQMDDLLNHLLVPLKYLIKIRQVEQPVRRL